jgi:hypothetical protein
MAYFLHRLNGELIIISNDLSLPYASFYSLLDNKIFKKDTAEFSNESSHFGLIAHESQIDFSLLTEEEKKLIGLPSIYRDYQEDSFEIATDGLESWKAYSSGFKKAQEALSDKEFSLDDIMNAFYNGWLYRGEPLKFPSAKKEYLKNLLTRKMIKIDLEIDFDNPIEYKSKKGLDAWMAPPKNIDGKIKITKVI